MSIEILSIAVNTLFLYKDKEYILVRCSDGGFNLEEPFAGFYKLPQNFYCIGGRDDGPDVDYLTYICEKYLN